MDSRSAGAASLPQVARPAQHQLQPLRWHRLESPTPEKGAKACVWGPMWSRPKVLSGSEHGRASVRGDSPAHEGSYPVPHVLGRLVGSTHRKLVVDVQCLVTFTVHRRRVGTAVAGIPSVGGVRIMRPLLCPREYLPGASIRRRCRIKTSGKDQHRSPVRSEHGIHPPASAVADRIQAETGAIQLPCVGDDEILVGESTKNRPPTLTVTHQEHLVSVYALRMQPASCSDGIQHPGVRAQPGVSLPVFLTSPTPIAVKHQCAGSQLGSRPEGCCKVRRHEAMTAMHDHKRRTAGDTLGMRVPARQQMPPARKRRHERLHRRKSYPAGIVVETVIGNRSLGSGARCDGGLKILHVLRRELRGPASSQQAA